MVALYTMHNVDLVMQSNAMKNEPVSVVIL